MNMVHSIITRQSDVYVSNLLCVYMCFLSLSLSSCISSTFTQGKPGDEQTPHSNPRLHLLVFLSSHTCCIILSSESMLSFKLRKHLDTVHKDKKDKPLDYFKILHAGFKGKTTVTQMFRQRAAKADKGLLVFYEISKLIAKAGKPHNFGESLILPAVSVLISIVMYKSAPEITKGIPFSNSSVSSHIDVKRELFAQLQVKEFATQINESTQRDNEALLMTCVKFL